MRKNHFLIICLIVTLSSCYYDNEEYLYGPDECGPNGFSYKSDSIDAIFQNNCATSGCHGDVQSPLLTSLESIQNNAVNIKEQVESGAMPKTGSLTEEQITKISCWINAGAPDN